MRIDEWRAREKVHADSVVEAVNELRALRGLTVRELSGRLASAGWVVSTSTLNGILSARKRNAFTVCEMLALAEALDVSPSELPFPAISAPAAEALRNRVRRETLTEIIALATGSLN